MVARAVNLEAVHKIIETKYPDDLKRLRVFPPGTPDEVTHLLTPEREWWVDETRSQVDPPEIHRQDDTGYIGGVGAMCLPEGTKHTWYSIRFGDGLTVELFLPHGTAQEQFHTTTPLCEVWKDENGNEIDPPADASSRSLRWPDFPWEYGS